MTPNTSTYPLTLTRGQADDLLCLVTIPELAWRAQPHRLGAHGPGRRHAHADADTGDPGRGATGGHASTSASWTTCPVGYLLKISGAVAGFSRYPSSWQLRSDARSQRCVQA